VPTHHSRHRLVHGRQRFSPTLHPGVDQDHLLLVARSSVAENRLAEAVEVTADRVWQGSEQLHLVGTELSCSPGRDGVRNRRRPSTGECDEVTIGVPPHPQHPLAQGDQPIQWVSTGIGPVAMSPVRTISSAATTSGSASTASRAGSAPWISDNTTVVTPGRFPASGSAGKGVHRKSRHKRNWPARRCRRAGRRARRDEVRRRDDAGPPSPHRAGRMRSRRAPRAIPACSTDR